MTTGQDVLVVVPCLNEHENLAAVLTALLNDAGAPAAMIAVVDGGSTDGTIEIAETFAKLHSRLVLLPNPKRLQSAAVNLAAVALGAQRNWIVRVDAHCEYPDNYISSLLSTALRTGADSVVVPIISRANTCFQQAVAVAQNSRLGSGGSAHRQLSGGGWVDHGHHALFRSANFLAVGGYDETFPANEDAEFDVRLVRAGGRIWLEDSGAILYLPRRSAIKLFVQYVKYGEGRARTLLRHRSQAKLRQLLPIMVAPAVVLLAPALWQPVLALPALTWAGACMLYGAWLGAKTRQWCPWMSGPVAMIMHFGWSLGFWLRLAQGPGPGFVSALGNRPSPIDPPAPSATTMEIAGSH